VKYTIRQLQVIRDGGIDPSIFGNCSFDPQLALQDALDCEEDFHNDDVILDIFFECDEQHKSQQFIDNCIAYVAGYIVFQLRNMAICKVCQLALQNTAEDSLPADVMLLIKRKKRGELITPSKSVYLLVKWCEAVFETEVIDKSTMPTIPQLPDILTIKAIRRLDHQKYFPTLKTHVFEQNLKCENDHRITLVKRLFKRYFQFRIKAYLKVMNCPPGDKVSKRNHVEKMLQFLGM
jgi:hypothetical protein